MSHRKSDLGIPCTRKSAKVALARIKNELVRELGRVSTSANRRALSGRTLSSSLGRASMSVHISETRVVRGACPQDCPDTCAFLYHVEDGKLVDVTGDPAHPMTL